MNSRLLAQHFTVNIKKFQLPRKGLKSQLSRSSCMYMTQDQLVMQTFNYFFWLFHKKEGLGTPLRPPDTHDIY